MPRTRRPAEERFFAKVVKTDTCWLWTGADGGRGYGRFKVRSYVLVSPHRWSYEFHVGPIPDGLHIDHLCRVPACVNPSHLEPVTPEENVDRIPWREVCPAGHAFTPENTYLKVKPHPTSRRPARMCRTCGRERAAARRAARRQSAA